MDSSNKAPEIYRIESKKLTIGDVSLTVLSPSLTLTGDGIQINEPTLRIVGEKNETEVNGVRGIPLFPHVVMLRRIGIPISINGESVTLQWTEVNLPFMSWEGKLPNNLPFIIIETDAGTRIITNGDLEEERAVQEKPKVKEKKRRRHAKRSSKKRRAKGKSARKGRRV